MTDASGIRPSGRQASLPSSKDDSHIGQSFAAGRDPTGIFQYPTSVANVDFRDVSGSAEVSGTSSGVSVQTREITFVGGDGTEPELPWGSKISLAGLDGTLPMAVDNTRFFESGEGGYQELLEEAFQAMNALTKNGDGWGEPNKEMGFFGWCWRWFVKFIMAITNDTVNRLRFTRDIQNLLPFAMGYESFAIGGVVRAFDVDDRGGDSFSLSLAFKNRNASRTLVQSLSRWDWVWHSYTQISWSRFFDFVGQLPFLGTFFSFSATENFPSSKNHALASVFRLFFEGSWITRFFTGKTEGIVTFDKDTAAQNLAAESTGFEVANRNQYGSGIGREKTNDFRFEHRLPTDESIVRTFVTQPEATLVNNGAEHVLRCLAKHWRNMLYQDNGNFAHQRMEQLNPFETLRFHMPVVLGVLANLRGRNAWDVKVLGPFVKKLQFLNPSKIMRKGDKDVESGQDALAEIYGPCQAAQKLIKEFNVTILSKVCGGVHSRVEPLQRWVGAINDSLNELSREAVAVKQFVASVYTGIKLGYQLLKLVDWYVPSEKRIKAAIVNHIEKKTSSDTDLPEHIVSTALQRLVPKDERTLKELILQGHGSVEAAKLLLGRTSGLLERELRRKALDDRIYALSKGTKTDIHSMEKNKWYWMQNDQGFNVVIFKGLSGSQIKVVDVETQLVNLVDGPSVTIRHYIPMAEAISRAQKAFMTIEIDHGKRFSYNAFMEFGSPEDSNSMRTGLRRLVTLSQVQCGALDRARLNVLSEMRTSVLQVKRSAAFAASRLVPECKPQNVTVLGGGPTGLLAGIHCLQNVILTGGKVKIYEGRDAFNQQAATFERAQIVRLDSRQISMLRFHLGTGFEDVYIPIKGETDAHHGNTLPTQGFVEVTIKRLESMILDELINLRSKDLLDFYGESKIAYDVKSGLFKKKGGALKVDDLVFDHNNGGKRLTVESFVFESSIAAADLLEGSDYDIVLPQEKEVRSYRLVKKFQEFDFYHFESHKAGVRDVSGSFNSLPPIYASGLGRTDPTGIKVSVDGEKKDLIFDKVKNADYTLDFSATHVVVALGKPAGSPSHFYVTTDEPYSVCCIEGIKISMGMHNFGEKRWGSGLIDDLRSHSDQNTRVIGDFTKSVALPAIIERMERKVELDPVWKYHLDHLAESVNDRVSSVHPTILISIGDLTRTTFRRQRLQTRFFELGNNYYLGMELPREFNDWKRLTVEKVAPAKLSTAPDVSKKTRSIFQRTLTNHFDRLWYEATLEIIAEGDVYNPGGRGKIPQLYTIDSPFEQKLGELDEMEAFRLFTRTYRVHKHDMNGFSQIQSEHGKDAFAIPTKAYVLELSTKTKMELGKLSVGELFEPVDTFEVISKGRGSSIVRSSGGHVTSMSHTVSVGRVSDLARAPNGYAESKVALAAFPVAHVVSHRTLRVNRVDGRGGDDGYITAFVGDAQASPHFMRYSGLTGACINCMTINNLVSQALQGVPFEDRIQRYSFETNWSNGEVVQRGTGANYGQDGFLRPGFSYKKLIDYLYDRALEHRDIVGEGDLVLSRDWKVKLAAAIVPRGLETDTLFYGSLLSQLQNGLKLKLEEEVQSALKVQENNPEVSKIVDEAMKNLADHWTNHPPTLKKLTSTFSSDAQEKVKVAYVVVKSVIGALKQTIDFSVELRESNQRLSSELFNQPKPVDSIADDFAVEAQNFANALTQSAAFTAATVAFGLLRNGGRVGAVASAILGVWNIAVSFGSMTNVARYRNRNEEHRRKIFDEKMSRVMKSVFSLMTKDERNMFRDIENPFLSRLEAMSNKFLEDARYYNVAESDIKKFEEASESFKKSKKEQRDVLLLMRKLVQEFVPDTFHVNSYLQEDLVNVYKELDEMLKFSKKAQAATMNGASDTYSQLVDFHSVLESSIERGDVKYGFIKDHSWSQTPLPVTLKYIFGPLLCRGSVKNKVSFFLKKLEAIQKTKIAENLLAKPVQDLRELYFATQESQIGSMIFVSAFIVFCFSIFFSIFRLVAFIGPNDADGNSDIQWVQSVLKFAIWAALGTLLGSSLAAFHFVRKLRHLFALVFTLSKKRGRDPRISAVSRVTWTQILLVLVRLVTVLAAAVALPWAIYETTFVEDTERSDLPALIAAGSVLAAIVAAIFFFFVELVVRYNLDPNLGVLVCEPFRERIDAIKRTYTSDAGEIEPMQALEQENWAYTARQFVHEHRFDTVFAADRFGTIFQHLQSGNKKAKDQ